MVIVNINIRKLHEDAVIPCYATPGAAAFDLVSVADVIIAPGETALVPIGLAFEIPVGYVMDIRPRSGITVNTKLRVGNAPGTVDSDFRGEVNVIIDNIAQIEYEINDGWRGIDVAHCGYANTLDGMFIDGYYPHGTYFIRKGDRVAQALIQRIPHVEFTVIDALSETERGDGGFGSTGAGFTAKEAAENLTVAGRVWAKGDAE